VLPETSESTALPSVKPPLKFTVPVLVTDILSLDAVNETNELKVIVPVDTEIVWVLFAPILTVPATVKVFGPTASVMFEPIALGLIDKFPVVPLMVKLPLAIVSVVAVAVAFPIVSDPHTAAELIDRLTPELMTASSEEVGTCPRLQVAASHVVPAEAVLVTACAV